MKKGLRRLPRPFPLRLTYTIPNTIIRIAGAKKQYFETAGNSDLLIGIGSRMMCACYLLNGLLEGNSKKNPGRPPGFFARRLHPNMPPS
jgi:hypothetical protein